MSTVREHYERWERDEVEPTASFWPSLIGFLGYYPEAERRTQDWILKARRMLGLSQYHFGRHLGVIAENVRKWEHGTETPPASILEKIKAMATVPLVAGRAM